MRGKRGTIGKKGVRSGIPAMTALILLAGGIWVAGWSGIFSIKTISCRVESDKECSEEIKAELNQYVGKNLLSFRKAEIEERITSADRLVQSVQVKPRFPDSLMIAITSRKPAAEITSAESVVEAIEVDRDGVILGKIEAAGELPRLVWPEISNWPIEQRLPEYIVSAVELSILATQSHKLVVVPKVEGEGSLVMVIDGGLKVRLSLDKEPLPELTRLQVVLNQVRIEGKQVKEIDMRFSNPVVR